MTIFVGQKKKNKKVQEKRAAAAAAAAAAASTETDGSPTTTTNDPAPVAYANGTAAHADVRAVKRSGPVKVAIIGGGLSGAAVAWGLAKASGAAAQYECHVFDTGRRHLGGRCSSRVVQDTTAGRGQGKNNHKDAPVLVDHACQMFAVSDAAVEGGAADDAAAAGVGSVAALFRELEAQGIIRKLDTAEEVMHIDVAAGGVAEVARSDTNATTNPRCYVSAANNGQGWCGLSEYLVRARDDVNVAIHRGAWVQRVQQVEGTGDNGSGGGKKWRVLMKGNGDAGSAIPAAFDYVVFTHSGKCATQLINTSNVDTLLHKPLECRFLKYDDGGAKGGKGAVSASPTAPALSPHKLDICSLYVMVVKVSPPTDDHPGNAARVFLNRMGRATFAMVRGDRVLKMVGNNTRKYGGGSGDGSLVLTLVSTPEFAGQHKGPQENLPQALREKVTAAMLEHLRTLAQTMAINADGDGGDAGKGGLGLRYDTLHLQLWGAALPANVYHPSAGGGGGGKGSKRGGGGYAGSSVAPPRAPPGSGDHCIHDAAQHIGVAGDWLSAGSVEGAVASGIDAARLIAQEVRGGRAGGGSSGRGWGFVPPSLAARDVTPTGSPAVVPGLYPTAREAPAGGGVSNGRGGAAASVAPPTGRGGGRGRGAYIPMDGKEGDISLPAGAGGRGGGSGGGKGDGNGKGKGKAGPSEGSTAAARSPHPDIVGNEEGAWKWPIRHRIWDYMEKHDIAKFPRPVHHRIPNFVGADKAASVHFASLPEFQNARVVKVNPDTPQKSVRSLTLRQKKTLLAPQPRLLKGFFSKLDPNAWPPSRASANGVFLKTCDYAATTAGARELGLPLNDFRDMRKYPADMVVLGSVAVNPHNGARIGKGEGFAEIEYAVLRMMGCITAETPVVTTVHDCQLVSEDTIPTSKLLLHDLCVDIIVTPTRVIRVPPENKPPKPEGIYWHLLSPQKLAQVKLLGDLKRFLEQEQGGGALKLGKDEVLPPTAKRRRDE